MPTNRLVVKETIAVYGTTLFDAVNAADGQDGVLEVRDQLAQVAAAIRGNADLSAALSDGAFTAQQRGELARNVFAVQSGSCRSAGRHGRALRGQSDHARCGRL